MRVPRKTKKWHKKHGYKLHFTSEGKAYWTRVIYRWKIIRSK